MCAKVIYISYTCWATTIIRKPLQGKKFTSSVHFNHYFWLTGGFKNTRLNWQIVPLVWVVQLQNAFSFRRASPPDPLAETYVSTTQSLVMSPTRAFCPPHCFRPGDAPELEKFYSLKKAVKSFFFAAVPPRTPLGELRTLPRLLSWLGRGHQFPFLTFIRSA